MEFKAFPKIERIGKMNMHITQKIHGTNAQVLIVDAKITEIQKDNPHVTSFVHNDNKIYAIFCGKHTSWCTPLNDNFGFALFVQTNVLEFVQKLGVGFHFGEWAGPGINSGEGLIQKTFILFDHWKFPPDRALPPQTTLVPVLYQGKLDITQIDIAMDDLKDNGSKLTPGFMRPEGIVVNLNGERFKKVFEAEETQWTGKSEHSQKLSKLRDAFDASPYLQPIRLEKLLSRDEKYLVGYPETLPQICKDYVQDLVDEGQIPGTNEDEIKVTKKAISRQVFSFIREMVKL